MMGDLKVAGLDDLRARFEQMPANLVKKSLRVGLRKAAQLVRQQAKANFDGAGGPNELTGALKASIRVTPRRGSSTRVVFNVVAGQLTTAQTRRFGAESAYYALWVEKGHINRKLGDALRGGTRRKSAARAASTSNTPAHPFMRPAIEAKGQEAIDLMVSTIRDNIAQDIK